MTTAEKMEALKKSLLKQKANSAKYGFDIGKHWKDMQKAVKK